MNLIGKLSQMPDFNDATPAVTVEVTSRLMQDYVAGTPLAPQYWWRGLTAPDGTENIFFIGPSTSTLSRAYRDAQSPTGWSQTPIIDVGSDLSRQQFPINFQRYSDNSGDVFRVIISPPDRVIAADMSADGTPGDFKQVAPGNNYNNQWADFLSYYLPQSLNHSSQQSQSVSWYLCDLSTYESIPVNLDPTYYFLSLKLITDGSKPGLCRMWGVRGTLVNGFVTSPWQVIGVTATLRADGSCFDTVVEVLLPTDASGNFFGDQTTHGPGSIEIVAMVQQSTMLGTIVGTFDPAGSSPVSWQEGKIAVLEPALPNGIMAVAARGDPNSDALEVFLTPVWLAGLWSSARAAGSADWEPLSPIITKGFHPQFLPAAETKFLYQDPDGLGVWTRNADGDWDVELIETPGATVTPIEQPGFRIGITLSSLDQFMGGASINATSSTPVRCTVAGKTTLLDSVKPTPFFTDSTGTLWITLKIQDRLCVPELTLTSDAFSGTLAVTPDTAVQQFLTSLTSDELVSAVDPRTSPPSQILPDPANGEAAADAIRESMKIVAVARTLDTTTVGSQRGSAVTNGGAARWSHDPRGGTQRRIPADALAGLGAWTLEMKDGKASFSRLDPQQAKVQREAMLALPAVPRPMNIFDDAFDWVGDLAESVWNGFIDVVTKIVVDGANLVLNLVIDGFNYAYQGVIDTLERAYDAVTFVLNAVGVQLGKAVGWLLSKLGFLFDWDALKGKRDELKGLLRSGVHSLQQSFPDPATTAANIIANLKTTQASFDAWITQYRSSPTDTQTFGGQTSSVLKYLEPLLQGSGSGFAEITWLIDKVRDALLRNMGLSGAPAIPGFAAAVSGLQQSVNQAAQNFSPTLDDASTLFDAWVLGGQLFSSSRFDPLLTIVQKHVDQLFGCIGGIANQGGTLLHLLWQYPDAILDWLDTPINVPFFAGFYEGLTGNEFSLLDVLCMCAAVPASAFSSAGARRMGAEADGWHIAGMSFAIIGCLTEGWASFEIASKSEAWGKYANIAADGAIGLCAVLEGLEDVGMLNFGVLYLLSAAAVLVAPDGWNYRDELGSLVSFLMLLVRLPMAATSDKKMMISQLLLMVQNLLEGFVSSASRKPDPKAFAALQASLSGAATGLAYS
jgi:hypothetical protein